MRGRTGPFAFDRYASTRIAPGVQSCVIVVWPLCPGWRFRSFGPVLRVTLLFAASLNVTVFFVPAGTPLSPSRRVRVTEQLRFVVLKRR